MIFFSAAKRRRREAAARLYAAAANAARHPALYGAIGVPDTLQGRFEMLALHLFPLTYRLMHVPGDDPDLARIVAESFVTDMDSAFREMGIGDLTVPKRMKTLYRSFGGRLNAYKNALERDDAALLDAIGRNVFPDGDPAGRAPYLADHLKRTVAALAAQDIEALQRGEAEFPEPSTSDGKE